MVARVFHALCVQCPWLVAIAMLGAACSREAVYYSSGLKRLEGQRTWFGKTEVGDWTFWYPNGDLREKGSYVRGQRTGEWVQWYPSGQRLSQGARRWSAASGGSERAGLWTFWFENGERRAKGCYRAGLREGHWDYTNEDGGLDGLRTGEYHEDAKID